jgi:hypothetical protein
MSAAWVPYSIRETLIKDHVLMSLLNPELFSEEAGIGMIPCWLVFGQAGHRKGDAIMGVLKDAHDKIPYFDLHLIKVPEDDLVERHQNAWSYLLQLLEKQRKTLLQHDGVPTKGTGLVIVLEHGDRLCRSRNESIVELFNNFPITLRGLHVQLIVCCDTPTSQLPPLTQEAYQYQRQIFFRAPNDEWRHAFFKTCFNTYKAFIANKEIGNYVHVDMGEDDYDSLMQCSAHTSIDDMYQFCSNVIHFIHKLRPLEEGDYGVQRVNGGELRRVLNYEFCKRFLKDKGGVYVISLKNGEQTEQQFANCAGAALPPPVERTAKTITNQNLYENGGVSKVGKLQAETVVVKEYVEEEEEEEEEGGKTSSPTKKREREEDGD